MFAYAKDSAFADTCLSLLGDDTCDRGGLFDFTEPCPNFLLCPQADKLYKARNLYDFTANVCDGDCVFDSLGHPLDTDFARAYIDALIAAGDTQLLGETSQYVVDENGEHVFLNESLLPILDDGLLPVTNDTDEGSAQRLAALGFMDTFPPFTVPLGAQLPVPEPATIFLVLAGLAGLRRHAG